MPALNRNMNLELPTIITNDYNPHLPDELKNIPQQAAMIPSNIPISSRLNADFIEQQILQSIAKL